jgi:hypothetical protein
MSSECRYALNGLLSTRLQRLFSTAEYTVWLTFEDGGGGDGGGGARVVLQGCSLGNAPQGLQPAVMRLNRERLLYASSF